MATNDTTRDEALERELGQLKSEYEKLRDDKVRTEQNLANIEQQLAELRRTAEEEYGTSDPEALARLLAERRAENERLVEEYRKHIEGIRQGIDEIEKSDAEGEA